MNMARYWWFRVLSYLKRPSVHSPMNIFSSKNKLLAKKKWNSSSGKSRIFIVMKRWEHWKRPLPIHFSPRLKYLFYSSVGPSLRRGCQVQYVKAFQTPASSDIYTCWKALLHLPQKSEIWNSRCLLQVEIKQLQSIASILPFLIYTLTNGF